MLSKALFQLFGYALQDDLDKEPINLDRESWGKIYKLSKKHDLAHLIGYALKKNNTVIDEDLQKAFEQIMNMAAFRYVKISYDLEAISYALEKAQVRFIPLKGSVIRRYYNEPWLRTSCDIDILISETDIEKAKTIFVDELNYTYESAWNYELSFFTPSKTHIELHHVLNDDVKAVDKVLSSVWEHSEPAPEHTYLYEMNDEMYYFYHIAHMAKHFVNGGCGIRPFIDIWVLNHNCTFDKEKRYRLLDEAGLLQFAKAAEELSEVWVNNKSHSPLTEQLEQFILSGGTYGTVENRVMVQQAVTGGRFSYILSRIFLPYDQLKKTYPNLEKRKWLFPFYQIKRWFRLFKKGRLKKSIYEAKTTSSLTVEENDNISELLASLFNCDKNI
ncbi:MAG: nucleotidyltransferase family protein [Clostridia bacterium]|nr:nucleotidyltransferase family protein [Clostridia bacterium]